jgi:hypothetical protein
MGVDKLGTDQSTAGGVKLVFFPTNPTSHVWSRAYSELGEQLPPLLCGRDKTKASNHHGTSTMFAEGDLDVLVLILPPGRATPQILQTTDQHTLLSKLLTSIKVLPLRGNSRSRKFSIFRNRSRFGTSFSRKFQPRVLDAEESEGVEALLSLSTSIVVFNTSTSYMQPQRNGHTPSGLPFPGTFRPSAPSLFGPAMPLGATKDFFASRTLPPLPPMVTKPNYMAPW